MNRPTMLAITAVAALATAFFVGTSIARPAVAIADAKIATINIQTVFDKYVEREDRLKQLQAEAAGLEKQFGTVNEQINQARVAANALPDGPAKEAELEKVVDRDVIAQIEIKKAKAKLEKAQADTIRMIFSKIQAESAKLAQINGYSMVMVADDWVTISPRATSQEATQLMSLRRFLYVDSKQHDITSEVLKNLNDAYAANKPAAPAPAPTTPAAAPGANH